MRRRSIRLIHCLRSVTLPTGALVLVVLLPGSLEAQQAKPAMLADVVQLLENGVPGARVVWLTAQSCRAFEVDEAAERELTNAGADPGLIQSLRGICYRAPEPTPEERQRERDRAAQAERDRLARDRAAQAERDRQARLAANRRAEAERRELAESVALLSQEVLLRLDRIGYRPVRSLLRDDFSANTLGWIEVDEPGGNYFSIRGGRAYITTRKPKWSFWPPLRRAHDDVAIRFDLRYESGPENQGAGVVLRDTGTPPDFRVEIDAAGDARYYKVSTYDVSRPEGSGGTDVIPWTRADELIRTGDNTVELIVTGNSFSLFLNGRFVQSGAGIPLRNGEWIRLYVSNTLVHYSFDNLVVVALEPK